MHIEFLWFDGCRNYQHARNLLRNRLKARDMKVRVHDVIVTDPDVGAEVLFPGSPTIRIDGIDVEPNHQAATEFTLRSRLYPTSEGLQGLPEPAWIDAALDRALGIEPDSAV
ncbi:MAG TPA: hypothetical protein QF624_04080 [Dehalococcoidia bacterium]|nr:hypothetical protein [Dehalococcoidia bacterium]